MTRTLLILSWAVGALLVIGWWGVYLWAGDSCELGAGTSVYGRAGWTWAPPGWSCSWTTAATGVGPLSSGPSAGPALATLALLGWPLPVWVGSRAGRRSAGG